MVDKVTVAIIAFFILSSYFGHQLLHRVIKTPAQYVRYEEAK
jgi:cell division protein FtsB